MGKRETRDIMDTLTGDRHRTPDSPAADEKAPLRPVTTQLDDRTKARLEAVIRKRYGLALSAGIRMVLLGWLEREGG